MPLPIQTIKRLIAAHAADQTFVATVSAVSGNRIAITRPGQTSPDGQAYAAAAGLAASVSVGQQVLCHRAGAGVVVVAKVVT